MTRFLLLATAMALMPVDAMASSTQPGRAKLAGPGALSCTSYNPCAVPTPAISDLPPLDRLAQPPRVEPVTGGPGKIRRRPLEQMKTASN